MSSPRHAGGRPVRVLVVDGANVVGSRADGWWRDRAGAARRLHEELSVADLPHEYVVLVLEGAAKAGHPQGRDGHVRTVHAPRSGDDAIVRAARDEVAAGHEVVVVTADRALQARAEAVGASCLGPSWLLSHL